MDLGIWQATLVATASYSYLLEGDEEDFTSQGYSQMGTTPVSTVSVCPSTYSVFQRAILPFRLFRNLPREQKATWSKLCLSPSSRLLLVWENEGKESHKVLRVLRTEYVV